MATIHDEIYKAGALGELVALRHAKERRPMNVRRLQVITIPEEAPTDIMTPPGTVQLFVGFPDRDMFLRCRRMYETQDFSKMERVHSAIKKQGANLSVVSVEDAARMALSATTITDFRYGGHTLLPDIFLPREIDVAAAALPYNEYMIAEDRHDYEYFVVVRPPALTDVEKAALSSIPPELSELNIASAPTILAATPGVVVYLVLTTVASAVCFTDIANALREIHLDDKDIVRLGARASAAELVHLRREVFERLAQ
jgi:hypothetical protein